MAAGASSGSASAAAVAKMGRSLSGRRCMKVGLCMRAPGIGTAMMHAWHDTLLSKFLSLMVPHPFPTDLAGPN
eukprot:scaffold65725_cov18-Tisochrysis_lutea.AAC.2